MTDGQAEGSPEQGGPIFGLDFVEASIMYSLLYERFLITPNRKDLMDEIERRELYATHRHAIPKALDCIENIRQDLREFLVSFAGEEKVGELESRAKKAIEQMKRGS
jgi:hypothetical protein